MINALVLKNFTSMPAIVLAAIKRNASIWLGAGQNVSVLLCAIVGFCILAF
jgi:hypothetical protein